jgi:hypothetical protein
MKIYLGPWKKETKRFYWRDVDALCYSRQVLTPKGLTYSKILGGNCYIGCPEIWYDEYMKQFCVMTSYVDDDQEYGSLENLMGRIDKDLITKGYGLGEKCVVLLTQEQYDKLSVLV